jgi:Acyl-CoA dehydrogenases
MDFDLTDEQRLIQETVRAFVDERVLPVAVQNDIDHKLDLSLIEGMAELGILGHRDPRGVRRRGLDFVAEALSCEEIERGEAAFRTLISVHVGSTRSRCSSTARGAEAALADAAGEGREARLLRADEPGAARTSRRCARPRAARATSTC